MIALITDKKHRKFFQLFICLLSFAEGNAFQEQLEFPLFRELSRKELAATIHVNDEVVVCFELPLEVATFEIVDVDEDLGLEDVAGSRGGRFFVETKFAQRFIQPIERLKLLF